VGRAQGVDLKSLKGTLVRLSDKRLSSQVKNKMWAATENGLPHFPVIPNVANLVTEPTCQPQLRKEWGGRGQGKAGHFRAHLEKPDREPTAFESCVTGKPYTLILEGTLQGHILVWIYNNLGTAFF
jgi:hypothetical protein